MIGRPKHFAVGILLVFATVQTAVGQEHSAHHGHHMNADDAGMVMNENLDTLPRDCTEISEDIQFTIHAGHEYASGLPGQIYGMSHYEVKVPRCARVEITFINEDKVRHQWMVHGLPKYLYPAGMFHIEVSGGRQKTGTFIVPGGDQTYLIHCDLAQHMEKGMRGQLVVGNGSGELWGIQNISDDFIRSSYLSENVVVWALIAMLMGFILSVLIIKLSNSDDSGQL